jgi:hypothetical protein
MIWRWVDSSQPLFSLFVCATSEPEAPTRRNDTARQAFEVYVTTSDYLIAQAESIIKSGAKALK